MDIENIVYELIGYKNLLQKKSAIKRIIIYLSNLDISLRHDKIFHTHVKIKFKFSKRKTLFCDVKVCNALESVLMSNNAARQRSIYAGKHRLVSEGTSSFHE